NIRILAAMIHTIWTIARMMMYLNVPFGYAAVQRIFKRALRGIKQVEIYDHHERKGLHEEDNLQHVLQDSIPQEMIRVAPPPEPEEPNKPVKVPECAICVIHQ